VGHSLFQRFELWKTSWSIIQSNWLFGVGTGDVPDVFHQTLKDENSPLQDTKLRSHNQYLSLFIAFGVVGFLLCLFSFIYPFVKSKLIFDYFCTIFLIVFLMSMLTEDTIESQDGVTFYAFFAALYLFQKPLKKEALLTKTED
jgi:O-antigen ligase